MWNFTELRACLLPYLEKTLNDVDKIVYAREFDIKEWVISVYTKLCFRTEPLNNEEAEKVGLKGVLLVFHLREDKGPLSYCGIAVDPGPVGLQIWDKDCHIPCCTLTSSLQGVAIIWLWSYKHHPPNQGLGDLRMLLDFGRALGVRVNPLLALYLP
ncbi:hypothetical protein B0J17DRAFT_628605 [Rhizoctonia solani]|nr:hypothetical protein B0J17DRAFT_628605 [Rhizoctonia solani]